MEVNQKLGLGEEQRKQRVHVDGQNCVHQLAALVHRIAFGGADKRNVGGRVRVAGLGHIRGQLFAAGRRDYWASDGGGDRLSAGVETFAGRWFGGQFAMGQFDGGRRGGGELINFG